MSVVNTLPNFRYLSTLGIDVRNLMEQTVTYLRYMYFKLLTKSIHSETTLLVVLRDKPVGFTHYPPTYLTLLYLTLH